MMLIKSTVMFYLKQICIVWISILILSGDVVFGDSSPSTRSIASSRGINSNAIQRLIRILDDKPGNPADTGADAGRQRGLKKVYLSDRSITCNDGSRAGFYLRKHHGSKKWIIFLEGGWYCYDHKSCRSRWMRVRHLMTSTQWPETREIGGILSGSQRENPYWWDANHVYLPYCTSDAWSGRRNQPRDKFSFQGALVLERAVRDLLPLGLRNATRLLIGGSSAGGTGAMVNLDRIREILHDELQLHHMDIRGVVDSGWFLDRAPYSGTISNSDASEATSGSALDNIRKGIELWDAKMPTKCAEIFSQEPWRCYFGYRLYPTLKSPLFVFQWLFDEAQMFAENMATPVTKQQWDYIHQMGDSLRQSFENVTALFAPSCISHSVLTKRDWLMVKVDDVSIADALHCWEQHLDEHFVRVVSRTRTQNSTMQGDEPTSVPERHHKGGGRRQKKKHRNKGRNRNKQNKRRKGGRKHARFRGEHHHNHLNDTLLDNGRRERSVLKNHKRLRNGSLRSKCRMKVMEKCSWPQCNHSCPKLHNPYTGEELDFIELLKSFGLDMKSVALALDIDEQTLNNMDHTELLNLLTQSASK